MSKNLKEQIQRCRTLSIKVRDAQQAFLRSGIGCNDSYRYMKLHEASLLELAEASVGIDWDTVETHAADVALMECERTVSYALGNAPNSLWAPYLLLYQRVLDKLGKVDAQKQGEACMALLQRIQEVEPFESLNPYVNKKWREWVDNWYKDQQKEKKDES